MAKVISATTILIIMLFSIEGSFGKYDYSEVYSIEGSFGKHDYSEVYHEYNQLNDIEAIDVDIASSACKSLIKHIIEKEPELQEKCNENHIGLWVKHKHEKLKEREIIFQTMVKDKENPSLVSISKAVESLNTEKIYPSCWHIDTQNKVQPAEFSDFNPKLDGQNELVKKLLCIIEKFGYAEIIGVSILRSDFLTPPDKTKVEETKYINGVLTSSISNISIQKANKMELSPTHWPINSYPKTVGCKKMTWCKKVEGKHTKKTFHNPFR